MRLAVRVRVFGGTLGCTTDRVVLIQTTYVAAADVRKQARAIFPHKFNRFGKLICPSGWLSEFSSSPGIKNISLFQNPKSPVCPRHPAPFRRDVSRSSRHVGAGCDGRGGIAGRAMLVATVKSRGPGAPTLASSLPDWRCRPDGPTRRKRRATEANKPGTPGRSRISRKAIAQGMPVFRRTCGD